MQLKGQVQRWEEQVGEVDRVLGQGPVETGRGTGEAAQSNSKQLSGDKRPRRDEWCRQGQGVD